MKHVCQICGYVYDETRETIPFDQLPADWKCPLCGAAKGDFQPEETKRDVSQNTVPMQDADLQKLSAGQMAALCANMARGCKQQYKAEEEALFRQMAGYYASITPAVEEASVIDLAANLQADIDHYPGIRATVDAEGDRGAARICVWGDKVSRMLASLVNRYLTEGESMMMNMEIWVCSVCGFVYIGEKAPEQCPVCKVPDWKFEKIEGRA